MQSSALNVLLGVQDPRGVLEGLGSVVAEAAGLVEMAGVAAFAPKKAASSTAPPSEDALNLSDVFTRVYLARVCAAVVFSERAGVSGSAGPFYQMLTLLATRSVLGTPRRINRCQPYFLKRVCKESLAKSR